MPQNRRLYYKAVSNTGEVVEGDLTGKSRSDVSQQLRDAGLRPLFIGNSKLRSSFLQKEIGRPKTALSTSDCKQFCETLAMMLNAGLRIDDAMLASKTIFEKNKRISLFVIHLHHRLRLGERFHSALRDQVFEFPVGTANLIESGEESGDLPAVLTACAKSFERELELRSSLVNASAYPAVVLFVAAVAVSILSLLVAPQLVGLFASLNTEVPATINALSNIGAFLKAWFVVILSCLFGSVLTIPILLRAPKIRNWLLWASFATPIVDSFVKWGAAGRFSTSLRLGRIAGVPEERLAKNAIMASNCPNASAQADICVQMLRRGNKLSAWIRRNNYFPKLLVQLIETAEQTGAYSSSLKIVETESERVLRGGIEKISSVLAPALILVVGAFIGSIVFSVFSALNNLGALL